MRIRYSPVHTGNQNTVIEYVDESTIEIDGEVYEFDKDTYQWDNLIEITNGAILEAHRDLETGELYVTVRRYYTGSCSDWDTGDYHDIKG